MVFQFTDIIEGDREKLIKYIFRKQIELKRRLQFILLRSGASTVEQYLEKLERDPQVLLDFKNSFTINVSEFFRNPERFADLHDRILPLLREKACDSIKAWSAGCSIGSEAYSLTMLFEKAQPNCPYEIWATDIDEEILQKAKEGIYRELHLKNVSTPMQERYFTPGTNGEHAIVPTLKRKVSFRKHDLLHDAINRRFDLIVCRNVIIYFAEQAKDKAISRMSAALKKGGFLWIGSTERIPRPEKHGLRYFLPFFYRKEG